MGTINLSSVPCWIISLATLLAFILSFAPLYNTPLGRTTAALFLLPVLAFALCFGTLPGLFMGLLSFPVTYLMFAKVVDNDLSTFTPNLYALHVIAFILGGVIGHLRSTARRMRSQMDDLRRSEAAREELIVELDAFAHTVAHDIKGPINAIIGFAALLRENNFALNESERNHLLSRVEQHGFKTARIVDELLLLSAIRAEAPVTMNVVTMDWIVQEVLVRLSYLIESSEAQISQLENWPPCRGYAPWIEEIWVNYISNAIKYGGHPPLIELGATPLDRQRVKFWVQDNGDGIPLEDADRLFNPHVRLDNIRATGSGLGLSIVRRIASRLEGEVGYEAVENGGSRFYFILPVV